MAPLADRGLSLVPVKARQPAKTVPLWPWVVAIGPVMVDLDAHPQTLCIPSPVAAPVLEVVVILSALFIPRPPVEVNVLEISVLAAPGPEDRPPQSRLPLLMTLKALRLSVPVELPA